MINAGDTVTFCIGGRVFVTRRATLYRLPDSRLYMIANRAEIEAVNGMVNKESPVYFFDRDPEIFRFVLDYYRTGELHLPSSICGPFVRKELIFWGIDESLIGACCMPAYMRYDEEKRTKKTLFRDFFEDIDSIKNLVKYCRGIKRWRYRMWLFIDHPSSSLSAKIWAAVLLGLMITSFMCFCLSTHEAFRKQTQRNLSYNNSSICNKENIETNRKIRRDCTTEPLTALVLLDVLLNIIFTVEFFLKLLLAPYKTKFLKSSISILDICIMSSYWIYTTLFYFYYYYPSALNQNLTQDATILWALNVLSMTQSLRILRIFKISKISRGLRVLMLTIKKSIPELVLLAFLLMNGMFLFSSLIYMAEYKESSTFPDIPKAFWWSIVTLTTVGYGDSYPRGGPGYLVGSVTAICGCILTGLAIPIIGNNFNTYYMYMKNQLKEDKYLKELEKDMSHCGKATKVNGHKGVNKGKYAVGNKDSSNNFMFRRKFTTVECPLFAANLTGLPRPISDTRKESKSPEISVTSSQIPVIDPSDEMIDGSVVSYNKPDNTPQSDENECGEINIAFSSSYNTGLDQNKNKREDYV